MSQLQTDVEMIQFLQESVHAGQFFALADAAQSSALPGVLNRLGNSQCLFDVRSDSPLAGLAPHLIQLPLFDAKDAAWKWILRNGPKLPCVTIICTSSDFASLLRNLRALSEIKLPDGDEMFFAFWDPAILGVLVGQSDDMTLHVRGPVLTAEQRAGVLLDLNGWLYWDRAGTMHSIVIPVLPKDTAKPPLNLVQSQVDDLVEASLPDQIRYYIELNQPLLFKDRSPYQRYHFARTCLAAGRAIGLARVIDIVNYTCASLLYEDRMKTDPVICALLNQVKRGELDFESAMRGFP